MNEPHDKIDEGYQGATGNMGTEVMGRPILDFIVEKDRKKMAEAIRRARSSDFQAWG